MYTSVFTSEALSPSGGGTRRCFSSSRCHLRVRAQSSTRLHRTCVCPRGRWAGTFGPPCGCDFPPVARREASVRREALGADGADGADGWLWWLGGVSSGLSLTVPRGVKSAFYMRNLSRLTTKSLTDYEISVSFNLVRDLSV